MAGRKLSMSSWFVMVAPLVENCGWLVWESWWVGKEVVSAGLDSDPWPFPPKLAGGFRGHAGPEPMARWDVWRAGVYLMQEAKNYHKRVCPWCP